jgi:hypothetical protein
MSFRRRSLSRLAPSQKALLNKEEPHLQNSAIIFLTPIIFCELYIIYHLNEYSPKHQTALKVPISQQNHPIQNFPLKSCALR